MIDENEMKWKKKRYSLCNSKKRGIYKWERDRHKQKDQKLNVKETQRDMFGIENWRTHDVRPQRYCKRKYSEC